MFYKPDLKKSYTSKLKKMPGEKIMLYIPTYLSRRYKQCVVMQMLKE